MAFVTKRMFRHCCECGKQLRIEEVRKIDPEDDLDYCEECIAKVLRKNAGKDSEAGAAQGE